MQAMQKRSSPRSNTVSPVKPFQSSPIKQSTLIRPPPPTIVTRQPVDAMPVIAPSIDRISSSTVSPPATGGWSCEACTFMNMNLEAPVCEVCGSTRIRKVTVASLSTLESQQPVHIVDTESHPYHWHAFNAPEVQPDSPSTLKWNAKSLLTAEASPVTSRHTSIDEPRPREVPPLLLFPNSIAFNAPILKGLKSHFYILPRNRTHWNGPWTPRWTRSIGFSIRIPIMAQLICNRRQARGCGLPPAADQAWRRPWRLRGGRNPVTGTGGGGPGGGHLSGIPGKSRDIDTMNSKDSNS